MKIRQMIALVLAGTLLSGTTAMAAPGDLYYHYYQNTYDKFSVPAMVTQIGSQYYLTDTYHDQILRSEAIGVAPKDWSVMAYDLKQPHGIAGDGTVFLALDTENDRVKVYVDGEEGYTEIQNFEHIGVRPHAIAYLESKQQFCVWSSMTGEMYYFARTEGKNEVNLIATKAVKRLYGKYTRSFTVDEARGEILLPSMDAREIVVVDEDSFRVKKTYTVPESLGGMVQILPVDGGYILTTSTDSDWNHEAATIIFADSLQSISDGKVVDVNAKFGGDGAPYYITKIGDIYYTPVLKEKEPACLYSFRVEDGILSDVTEYFY
ncbi:MAG: hypothetical protein K6G23_02775 [Lachnospiraceae bacterium]|nr:hypothetical protein [Lachnospiraceae bacterium]